MKTIAAYELGKTKFWKQLHIDETRRHQTSLVNVVMGYLADNNTFKTICVNVAIIAKDGMAESQCHVIISSIRESTSLLKVWREETANMFPGQTKLIQNIPDPSLLDIT